MSKATRDKIIVGIDFGTTFSGIAFQYAASDHAADRITLIKSWPGGNHQTSDKVPTQLVYKTDGGGLKWGYEVQPTETSLRCIKLLLDEGQSFPDWASKAALEKELSDRHKSATDVIADYMTKLHDFAIAELGKAYTPAFLQATPIEFILTVPAVWSDVAKQATRDAAKRAGFGDSIHLISEPEAAAVETLSTMKDEDLHEGDVFVICDAGGGTVDLITYEVEDLDPIRLREVVPGTGGLCGASFLNSRFESLVRERLGTEKFDEICKKSPKTWANALTYFESYVKRNFNPTDEDDDYDHCGFSVPLNGVSDDEEAGVEFGFMSLSNDEVADIFAPVVSDVIDLVQDQYDASDALGYRPRAVVLVGGFGQSQYLFSRLKEHFQGKDTGVEDGVIVMRSSNAWSAVVRGAVLRGLTGMELVTSRKARLHYGVACSMEFVQGVHEERHRFWCKYSERWMASQQIQWFAKKGDSIGSSIPVLHPFSQISEDREGFGHFPIKSSHDDDAPRTCDHGTGVRTHAELSVDLALLPDASLKMRKTSCGTRYYEAFFDIGMHLESGVLRFDYRVRDQVLGDVEVKFE
ncbi:Heat shock protein 12B [Sphaceloma murrayae]|uniref:Heat shock protein 12B n=1 Tax=Sphaceloma murrayae TaxID=2082308 RepID=A0A2K1QPF6_9PEZI|nr:Heat shock protein 12B [Sphaceloma murrayae]